MKNQNRRENYSARVRTLTAVRNAILCTFALAFGAQAAAQTSEVTGSRALGMGGAFVAVANDSSATWWNPAGIAAGPLLDIALTHATVEGTDDVPAVRQQVTGFAFATPPLGVSYYRFRVTDIQPFDPTGSVTPRREDVGAEMHVGSLAASQLGLTLVQTLIPGLHAGVTVKYLRGRFENAREPGGVDSTALLDTGDDLHEAETDGRMDLDLGLLAVIGPMRLGARMRNVREPELGGVRLPRQSRAGIAFDPERTTGLPLVVALDADLAEYQTSFGPRRRLAIGAEHWLWNRRLGVRAGGRANTTGARERAVTAGASFAVRAGVYVDGHVVTGSAADERGWGLAARLSF